MVALTKMIRPLILVATRELICEHPDFKTMIEQTVGIYIDYHSCLSRLNEADEAKQP